MESLLEAYHAVVSMPFWALRWPMAGARMLMLVAVGVLAFQSYRARRYTILAFCIFPAIYYLDAAVVQTLSPVRTDTPTLVKTMSNVSWIGMIGYLYTLCRKLDRLTEEGLVRREYTRP